MVDTPAAPPFAPFTLGRYRVVDVLGIGGMGTVHLAEMRGVAGFTKRLVIKLIHPTNATNPVFRGMFVDEANVMLSLKHPNVVEVLELQEDGDQLYMVMEYVDGMDLHRLLKALHGAGESLPLPIALHIVTSLLAGLAHAHAATGPDGGTLNLVHRDVTPGNVLLSRAGDVKLTDFGVVRAEGRTTRTMAGEVKGKVRYMAPEVIRSTNVGPQCDVFSAGVVTWETLSGHRLFSGKTDFHAIESVLTAPIPAPSQLRPDIPAGVDAAVLRALERAPEDRWESARAFRKALLAAARDLDPEEAQEDLGRLVARMRDAPPPDRTSEAPAPVLDAPPPAHAAGVDARGRAQTEGSLPALQVQRSLTPPALHLDRLVSSTRLPRIEEPAPFEPARAHAAIPPGPPPRATTAPRLAKTPELLRSEHPGEAIHVETDAAGVFPATAESTLAWLCSSPRPPACRLGVRADVLLDMDAVGRALLLDHLQSAPWLASAPASAGRVVDYGIGKMLVAAANNRFSGGLVLEAAPGAAQCCAFIGDGRLAYTFKRDPRDHLLALFLQHQADARKALPRLLRMALGGMPLPRAISAVSQLNEAQVTHALEQLARRRLVEAIRGPQARFFLLPGLPPPPGLPLSQQPLVSLVPQIYFSAATAEVQARVAALLVRPLAFNVPADPSVLAGLGVAAEAAVLQKALEDEFGTLEAAWPALAPPGSDASLALGRALVLLEQCGIVS